MGKQWQWTLLFLALTVARAPADPLTAVVVGPDTSRAQAVLVDVNGDTMPGPQDHLKITSGGQSLGEAIVYRVQGKRLTLYFLSKTSVPAAGAELSLDKSSGSRPVAAPAVSVQARAATPDYEKYRVEARKSLDSLDKFLGELPDTSLNNNEEDLSGEMASRAWDGSVVLGGEAQRAMLNMASKAPSPDIYSGQVARDSAKAIDDLKEQWGVYLQAIREHGSHQKNFESMKNDAANASNRNKEEDLATQAQTKVDNSQSEITTLKGKLQSNRALMLDALEKNN